MRQLVAIGVVALLLVLDLLLFYDFFFPFRYLWTEKAFIELFLSSTLFVLAVLSTFTVFFCRRSLLRSLTLPFFIFFFLFNIGYFSAASAPLDFQQAELIVRNFRWFAREAIENFGLSVLPVLFIFIPLVVVIEWLPRLSRLELPRKLYVISIGAVALVTFGLYSTNGFFDRYPSFFRVPSMFIFAEFSSVYDGERDAVDYSASLNAQVEKIVLIVDESIRADILGINGYSNDTTPYLGSLHTGLVNFGIAASASNCSDYSNLVLRTGLRKDALPDEHQLSLKAPSIWQFTRGAGYYNVYVDAQAPQGSTTYQNFMNAYETSFVDEILRVRSDVAHQSDRVALDHVVAHLRRPGKTFIILNKYGIHFPYVKSYPDQSYIFRPGLEPNEPMYDRERSLNSFMNGLRWSVDDWFRALLAEQEAFAPYVLVYTSDHGQNIVDDGTLSTHCRPRATRFEGMVPMLVFSNDGSVLDRLESMQELSYDATSHFQVFPTLLELAGYDSSWVRDRYGPALSEMPDTAPEFFVGDLHGRGSVRRWVSITPEVPKSE